jgi:8-oxo-dGTP pyrophosphatase MutT (NUDIX family)
MEKGKYRKAVFIVVYAKTKNEIEYLILRRKLHWKGWEFPKGGINPFEHKTEAVKREVKEETGLKAREVKKFDFLGRYRYKKKFADRTGIMGQTFSLYAVNVKKDKVKIDKIEHSKYEWLTFKDAVRKVRFNNQKRSLKTVNKWLEKK